MGNCCEYDLFPLPRLRQILAHSGVFHYYEKYAARVLLFLHNCFIKRARGIQYSNYILPLLGRANLLTVFLGLNLTNYLPIKPWIFFLFFHVGDP